MRKEGFPKNSESCCDDAEDPIRPTGRGSGVGDTLKVSPAPSASLEVIIGV